MPHSLAFETWACRKDTSIHLGNAVFFIDKSIVYTQYYVMQGNEKTTGPGESGLYNRIAVLRVERSISRQNLADAVGVNYQTIGFLERGDYGPSLALAFAIAEFFRLPVEAIFSRRPFKPLSEQLYGTQPAEAAKEKIG